MPLKLNFLFLVLFLYVLYFLLLLLDDFDVGDFGPPGMGIGGVGSLALLSRRDGRSGCRCGLVVKYGGDFEDFVACGFCMTDSLGATSPAEVLED